MRGAGSTRNGGRLIERQMESVDTRPQPGVPGRRQAMATVFESGTAFAWIRCSLGNELIPEPFCASFEVFFLLKVCIPQCHQAGIR